MSEFYGDMDVERTRDSCYVRRSPEGDQRRTEVGMTESRKRFYKLEGKRNGSLRVVGVEYFVCSYQEDGTE